jgi:hypothetical protein
MGKTIQLVPSFELGEYKSLEEVMKRAFLVLAVAVEMVFTVGGWAQNDAAGCKDSPILTRFPGSYIASCSKKDDDAADFPIHGQAQAALEGALETIIYQFPRTATKPQVVRNLNTALRSVLWSANQESVYSEVAFP